MTLYFTWRQTSSGEFRGSHGRNYKKILSSGNFTNILEDSGPQSSTVVLTIQVADRTAHLCRRRQFLELNMFSYLYVSIDG
jgi:hypothetical protein